MFALLEDLSVRPAFTDHFIKDFHLLRIEPVGVGAGARFEIENGGGYVDSIIDVAEFPHRIVERGHGGTLNRVPNVCEWRLSTLPGRSGCEVEVTYWTEPTHPLDRLREVTSSERRLAKAWRRALERLRAIAEDGGPPERLEVAGGDRVQHV